MMDNLSHAQLSVGWNYPYIPKLQRLHRWRLNIDFVPHYKMDVITDPC